VVVRTFTSDVSLDVEVLAGDTFVYLGGWYVISANKFDSAYWLILLSAHFFSGLTRGEFLNGEVVVGVIVAFVVFFIMISVRFSCFNFLIFLCLVFLLIMMVCAFQIDIGCDLEVLTGEALVSFGNWF